MASPAVSASGHASERTFLGHPVGLYILFFAEAWERFSYYGMRALLVLYMVNHLKFDRPQALGVYATYTGLVYLTPMLGGYLADQFLGKRKAVIIGGVVMALGHFAMAFEPLLYVALGLLIIGNGFFKPNISTIVGGLYQEGDPRRDGAFTIFYMGINLGAFFSPLVCGWLGEKVGWHFGFGAAGVGMLMGLGVFLAGQRLLGREGFAPGVVPGPDTRLQPRDWAHIGTYVTVITAIVFAGVQSWPSIGPVFTSIPMAGRLLAGALLIGGALQWRRISAALTGGASDAKQDPPLTVEEWQRVAVICIIAVFTVFFWMGFEQAGGTMTLFADTQTDRHIGAWEVPASFFQSINPFLIVTLAPLFSMLWTRIDSSRFALSSVAKQGIGMIILGLGFIVMYFGQESANVLGTVGPGWLISVYTLHTLGEICLSPVGLSMVTKLAPGRVVSLMMGIWFASSAVANYLAGTMEHMLAGTGIPLYGFLMAVSIGPGVILLGITPLLRKWMGGRD